MAGGHRLITAAICAYNEAANIERLLRILLDRDGQTFDELIVVSSGSTDGTDAIVRAVAADAPKVCLISEADRGGKARAVNAVLGRARGDIVLLIDADCLPVEGALARLLAHFDDPGTGGTGAHNVVTNAGEGVVARLGSLLWELHHEVNLRGAVLGGDIVAFRRVVEAIAPGTVNDDYAIEAALKERGFRIEYEPQARVLMRAPTSLRDLLRQRRRIYAGYRAQAAGRPLKQTRQARSVLGASLAILRRRPAALPALVALASVEATARISIGVEGLLGRAGDYAIWEPAASTKGPLPERDTPGHLL